jgi:hypothetical protein
MVFIFANASALGVTPTVTVTTVVSKMTTVTPVNKPSADIIEILGADFSKKGKMKDHFRKGMKLFMKDQYDAAIPDLIASTMIVDPYTWDYWYAEAYATLGVIYEFHSKDPNCNKKAHQYYMLALKRDPKTKSANYYIDQVRPKNNWAYKSALENNKKSISSVAAPSNLLKGDL